MNINSTQLNNRAIQLLLVISLILLLASDESGANFLENHNQNQREGIITANSTGARPIWRRQGCFKIGHTRTISIPGCVKFNISTNACRGHCMSYSVPAGAMGEGQLVQTGFDVGALKELELVSGSEVSSQTESMEQHSQIDPGSTHQNDAIENNNIKRQEMQLNQFQQEKLMRLPMMMQQAQTTLTGAGQPMDITQTRPVISVSQCCSMVDTEEVVVNLRCGSNEVRRLVFNSAKSCECFFCRHH